MLNFITKWQIIFVLIDTLQSTISVPLNNTFGFFCVYCGRTDLLHSHRSPIDCSQPYDIYCSYREAIGCVKYVKIIDYHIEIIKDCLRLTELSSFDIQCTPDYPEINININEKRFCCNNTHFCNHTSSIFTLTNLWLLTLCHLFIFHLYHYLVIEID